MGASNIVNMQDVTNRLCYEQTKYLITTWSFIRSSYPIKMWTGIAQSV
jgi:hypothetical protein